MKIIRHYPFQSRYAGLRKTQIIRNSARHWLMKAKDCKYSRLDLKKRKNQLNFFQKLLLIFRDSNDILKKGKHLLQSGCLRDFDEMSLWTLPIPYADRIGSFYFFLFLLSRKARNATIKLLRMKIIGEFRLSL